jgi:hypothetical protein
MESLQRITTDVEKKKNRTAKVCALPGAQMRGTWATHLQWLCSLLPAPGPRIFSGCAHFSPGTWAPAILTIASTGAMLLSGHMKHQ